jgi:hypothetical protein
MTKSSPARRARKEFSKGEPCGCGSGIPYGQCCKHRQAKFIRDGRGTVLREVKLTKDAVRALDETEQHFRRVFGRKPGRGDKVFAATTFRYSPADIDHVFEKAALEAGTRKELIYARRKTDGLILTEKTFDMAPPADQAGWVEAIEEYREAAADGIDLLSDTGPVALSLEFFGEFLEHAVIHFGSYADRAPRRVRTDLSLFPVLAHFRVPSIPEEACRLLGGKDRRGGVPPLTNDLRMYASDWPIGG